MDAKLIKKVNILNIKPTTTEEQQTSTFKFDPSVSVFAILSDVISKFKSTKGIGNFKVHFYCGGVVGIEYTEIKKKSKS
jgi:hypothetical protein